MHPNLVESMTRSDFVPLLLPAPAAAHYLGVSETKLRTLGIRRKVLDGKRLFDRRDLDDFANNLASGRKAGEAGGTERRMRQGIRAGVKMRLKGIKVVTKPDGRICTYTVG